MNYKTSTRKPRFSGSSRLVVPASLCQVMQGIFLNKIHETLLVGSHPGINNWFDEPSELSGNLYQAVIISGKSLKENFKKYVFHLDIVCSIFFLSLRIALLAFFVFLLMIIISLDNY